MDRRGFVRTTVNAAGGSLLLLTSKSAIAQETAPGRRIKCALVGCGAQGNALRVASRDVPDLQWVAVADIWAYNRTPTARRMMSENKSQVEGTVNEYNTIEELLEKEPSVEAVFIATPDFLHAPYSRIALSKGKAVYCEKMMSNTIEGAKDMVRAHKEFGGVFQIGHQRHSNPRYVNLRENVIKPGKMLGRITHCYAQWNRGVSASKTLVPPKGVKIPSELFGDGPLQYKDELEFLNWRNFSKYGGGPISDLGAHQIDMFNWMYEAKPVSVIASGGVDYYDGSEGRAKYELADNVMCIYEYKLPTGVMRAYYQVLTTTGSQGAYEKHMGVQGTAVIAELDVSGNQLYAEPGQVWTPYSEGPNAIIKKARPKNKFWEQARTWEKPAPPSYGLASADVRESKALDPWDLAVDLTMKPHGPHIKNFIEAVQMKKHEHLTCPVQMAMESCVTVLKCNESMANGTKVVFTPQDFEA
jgi:predicted dehydrogenase